MKRTVCTAAIALAIVACCGAAHSSERILVGVKGGVNLANLRGGDVFNNSIRPGGIGGVFARYALMPYLAIQPEALFAMKGATFKAEGITSRQRINYIEFPLLVRFTFPSDWSVQPGIVAGPALGVRLSDKITDGAKIDLKSASRSADFGVVLGAGVEHAIGKSRITLEGRYELGLLSTIEKAQDKEVKNSVTSIMVGYALAV